MFTGRYSPEEIVRELRRFGLDLFMGEDGVVHGRFRERGQKMTLGMRALAEELQGMNDQVAALLQAEERREYLGVTVEEALAIGKKVKDGQIELDGKVVYHKATGLCDLTVKGRCEG